MSDRDYYEILGLTPGVDGQMVDQAYWHLARKYQSLGAIEASARYALDELNEAYGVIGTPRLREQYDAFRDDVLITQGMIKPVPSKPKKRKQKDEPRGADPASEPRLKLPSLSVPNWRWYSLSTIIAALAIAGLWQGVQPLFAGAALAAGLAIALTPALKRQMGDFAVPRLPAVAMPEMKAPRLAMPRLGDVAMPKLSEIGFGEERVDPMDADVLQASTSAMIARWRKSVGLRSMDYAAEQAQASERPCETLLQIVEAERTIEEQSAEAVNVLKDSSRL